MYSLLHTGRTLVKPFARKFQIIFWPPICLLSHRYVILSTWRRCLQESEFQMKHLANNQDYIRIIKQSVKSGHRVFAGNTNYEVINDSVGQWLIHSKFNDHYIGLHGNLEMGYGLNSTGPFFIKVGGHQVNLTDFVSR